MQRAMPTTVYGLSVQAYSRFRLRQLFWEFADGTRRPILSSHAVTILPMSGFDGGEIVVTKIHRRRIDLALMMRYLRQWILSEPSRILHLIEDTNRLRYQMLSNTLEEAAEETAAGAATQGEDTIDSHVSAEQLALDGKEFQTEDFWQQPEMYSALDNHVFEVDIKNISLRRWLHAQVFGAYQELAMAHPEVVVDPKENLSIQDPAELQTRTESNQSEGA